MRISILWVLPLLLPLAAWAQSGTPPPAAANASSEMSEGVGPDGFGSQTRQWVDLQISGAESVKDTPSLSGDVATHIYQRYVNSFDHPIPDHFARENFVQGGGGSNGG